MPRTKKVKEELLTVAQVAEEKGVSRVAVLYAIRDGRLDAIRVGRSWIVPRSALAAYEPRAYRRRPTASRRVPRTQAG